MKIAMAHGSGGNATREIINNIFKKYFANTYLDKLEDAALLPSTDHPLAMTTDSYVISPLFFPGGDIGKLAVCGTVNDLWMVGAEPHYLTAGFILEEGLEISVLERVVKSMSRTAVEAGVQIVAGDTKVIEGRGGLYINTAGIGLVKEGSFAGIKNVTENDSIIVSGSLGNHHACILSQRMNIDNNISSDCASLGNVVNKLVQSNVNIKTMRDITRGGLATILNEIAESACVHMQIEETKIPVDSDVRSFCDILGLDPLYMANEGKLVCIVDKNDEEKAMEIIRNHPLGQNAQVIGRVIETGRSLVTVKTRLGGRRIIDILYGEGLPRIC